MGGTLAVSYREPVVLTVSSLHILSTTLPFVANPTVVLEGVEVGYCSDEGCASW